LKPIAPSFGMQPDSGMVKAALIGKLCVASRSPVTSPFALRRAPPREAFRFSGRTRPLQTAAQSPLVGIIMGSASDWPTMGLASKTLDALGVPHESKIVSAHRTPERLFAHAKEARGRGLKMIIAGAGGAAHLPGMVAALTPLPVLGVPVQSAALSGMDSLLSIVQMPKGVPVGTLAIGEAGAVNAALLAAAMLANEDIGLAMRLDAYRKAQTDAVADQPPAA